MSSDKLLVGLGAACIAGCAAATVAPLLLSVTLAGWHFGVGGALLLLAGALAVGVVRRKTRTAAACRVDGSCGFQAAHADTESVRR